MGFFHDFVEGFTNGFQSMVANGSLRGQERGRIELLCRELGWEIDERDAEAIRLHFNCPNGDIRKVSIYSGDADLVQFMVSSMVLVRTVPQQVMEYLLMRPVHLRFGSWIVSHTDDGDAVFILIYSALGVGLTSSALRSICQSMIAEAVDFDAKLRGPGLLR